MRLDYNLQYIIKWIVYFLNSKGKVLILLLASESYLQKIYYQHYLQKLFNCDYV